MKLLHCLAKINLPNIDNLDPSEIVALRKEGELFENWRNALNTGLTTIFLNKETMDWQSEAPLLLKNATEESRQKIEEEMKKSSFLYSVRSSFKTFTIGSIATVIAAHFTQEPISAILTAGIVAGLEVSDRIIKKQQNVNPLVQHYMSIK